MGAGTSSRYIGMWGYDQAQNAKRDVASLLGGAQSDALASLGRNFGQARNDATTNYAAAIDRLNPWSEAGTDALGVYRGSIGLGGDAARDSALAAYRASPGYERRVSEATDALARKASALGALGSGNTMQAISDRANYLADEDYGRWQGQVLGLSDRGQQAAGVQAGLQGQLGSTLAGLGSQQGLAESGLYQNFAGLGANNIWNATNSGINAVQTGQKNAADAVASRNSMTTNIIGSALSLLAAIPTGGLSLLGMGALGGGGLGKTPGSGGLY